MKKLFLPLLITAASFFMLAGCSEIINPEDGINELLHGIVTSSEDSSPIKGIKVSSNYGYTFTDENGYFAILSYFPVDTTNDATIKESKDKRVHELTFTDADGDENGKFKEQTAKFQTRSSREISVTMEKDL